MIPSDTRPCENGRQAAAEDLRHLTVILGILLLGIYLFWVWRFWPFTVDDAYISARYARNLVRGYGLVYNPGERVMGYTNLSLTLIEALVEQSAWTECWRPRLSELRLVLECWGSPFCSPDRQEAPLAQQPWPSLSWLFIPPSPSQQ